MQDLSNSFINTTGDLTDGHRIREVQLITNKNALNLVQEYQNNYRNLNRNLSQNAKSKSTRYDEVMNFLLNSSYSNNLAFQII
jgi:hypothetical protein